MQTGHAARMAELWAAHRETTHQTRSATEVRELSRLMDLTARGKMNQQPEVEQVLFDLKLCSMRRDLQWGRKIHAKAVENGNGSSMYVTTALIKMYAKCGSMLEARQVFDKIQKRDVVYWSALLLGYADNGEGYVALDLFSRMKADGCAPNSVTYIAVLKACACLGTNGGLEIGRSIHQEIGTHLSPYVQNTLIDMYAKCRSMIEAHRVFDNVQKRGVVFWTSLILGYAENGKGYVALELFSKMKGDGCVPNSITYVAVLKACTSLAEEGDGNGKAHGLEIGRNIHSEIGCHLNVFVQNTLIDMYAKCGSMVEAHQVFDTIRKPSVVVWTALILGYAENEKGLVALELFLKMKTAGCVPNSVTYVSVLKACTSLVVNGDDSAKLQGLEMGKRTHSEIGCHLNIYVQNTLIDMYTKCGTMADARRVFDSIKKPTVVSWTALLLGYADNGEGHVALELFSQMKSRGCQPDSVSYVAVLKACGSMGALALGRKFHSDISEFSAYLVTCLVDFYAKCGSMAEAHAVFDLHSRARGISTWNALLAGYSVYGDSTSVFKILEAMQDEGFRPDAVTFLCVLLCCSHAGLVKKAREYLEEVMPQYGVTPNVMHYTCMVDALGRGNQLTEAITMLQTMPCSPDAVVWMTLLGACCKWKNVEIGTWAFESLMATDRSNASAYLLMAQIYGSQGMWQEQARVLESSMELGASFQNLAEQAYVANEEGKMVKFVDGQEDLPEVKEKMAQLLQVMKEQGHGSKLDAQAGPCGHTERRAVVYGILKTPAGEPVRAFKNARMCNECHELTKVISKLSSRVVIVRDPSRFHVMANGRCSCLDYW